MSKCQNVRFLNGFQASSFRSWEIKVLGSTDKKTSGVFKQCFKFLNGLTGKMQFSYRMDSTAKNKHKNLCELFALNASRWDVSVATPQRQSFNFLLRCDTSKPSLPSDVFQSVFSLQVLDVLSYGWSSAVLLRQMLLEPLHYCLVVIPEISLRTKTSTVKTLENVNFRTLDLWDKQQRNIILCQQSLTHQVHHFTDITCNASAGDMTYLDRSLCFDKPAPQHGLHVSVTEFRVRLQDLTLHYLLQQQAAQTPVEEGPHVLPIQNILSRVPDLIQNKHILKTVSTVCLWLFMTCSLTVMTPFSCILPGVSWSSTNCTATWW